MGAAETEPRRQKDIASHFLVSVSLTIVILGLANTMPGIPGLDNGIRELVGIDWFSIRKFPIEWLYPIAFSLMMLCVLKTTMIERFLCRRPNYFYE